MHFKILNNGRKGQWPLREGNKWSELYDCLSLLFGRNFKAKEEQNSILPPKLWRLQFRWRLTWLGYWDRISDRGNWRDREYWNSVGFDSPQICADQCCLWGNYLQARIRTTVNKKVKNSWSLQGWSSSFPIARMKKWHNISGIGLNIQWVFYFNKIQNSSLNLSLFWFHLTSLMANLTFISFK